MWNGRSVRPAEARGEGGGEALKNLCPRATARQHSAPAPDELPLARRARGCPVRLEGSGLGWGGGKACHVRSELGLEGEGGSGELGLGLGLVLVWGAVL